MLWAICVLCWTILRFDPPVLCFMTCTVCIAFPCQVKLKKTWVVIYAYPVLDFGEFHIPSHIRQTPTLSLNNTRGLEPEPSDLVLGFCMFWSRAIRLHLLAFGYSHDKMVGARHISIWPQKHPPSSHMFAIVFTLNNQRISVRLLKDSKNSNQVFSWPVIGTSELTGQTRHIKLKNPSALMPPS